MRGEDRPPAARFKHPIGPQVHSILWNEWDPVGVNGPPADSPDDEYDAYVWPVIAKVMEGESIEQLADYLDWAAGEHMGMPQPRRRQMEVARKLVDLRNEGGQR